MAEIQKHENKVHKDREGRPITVDEGRDIKGSAGEGALPDQPPADTPPDPHSSWECMSCGSVYDEPFATCPKDGGSVRKVGPMGEPVFAEYGKDAPAREGLPKTGQDEDGKGPAPSPGSDSARIEDVTARGGESQGGQSPIGGSEDRKGPGKGDHRLQGERPHSSDAGEGSFGGGGGTGGG